MARRRYRRYRRKSGKWSPNIVKVSGTYNATSGEFYNTETLAVNNISGTNGVSQTYTIKNIDINFTIENESSTWNNNLESITAYIMYVPQGMNVTSSYYAQHPEYIMAYKYLGSPASEWDVDTTAGTITRVGQQYQPYRIRTRLSRKLQTGDSIILFIQGSNQLTQTTGYRLDGIVRWWSKAN